MRPFPVLLLLLLILCFSGCRKVVVVPAGSGTVKTIKFVSAPDGTATEVVALWKSHKVPFGVGKPYSQESAAQALALVRRHYRSSRIRKGNATLEL